jgi:uncharacterized protein YheU (UPF0270 family)
MIIPITELNPDTLKAIVESYVLREGTEYGAQDYSLEQKTEQVLAQLQSGDVLLIYSELHENVDIITRQQYEVLSAS